MWSVPHVGPLFLFALGTNTLKPLPRGVFKLSVSDFGAKPVMDTTTLKRWTKISLRTLHLVAVAGVGGGILFGIERDLWVNYWWLALASGVLLMAIDIVSNPVWLVQIRGLVIYLKLVLLAIMGAFPQCAGMIMLTVIILSSLISHAPGNLRYYSVYHRKVISSTSDSKG